MCSLGLLVGIFSAAAPQEAPTDRPVVVRFKNGPVIAAHGIPPYLTSGFEVQERNESRFWKPPQGKAMKPKAKQQPKPMKPETKQTVGSTPNETKSRGRTKAQPKQ